MAFQEISQAIYSGNVAKLRALREAGGEGFARQRTEKEQWNLLHMALLPPKDRTPIAVIEYLLRQGVEVNAKDCYGNTPLIYAARAKYIEAMRLLLDHGASIDLANNDGVTPLRQTLLSKPFSLDATELLLARGANPEAKMKNGKTVREFAHLVSYGADKAIGDLFEKYNTAAAG
jgi:ankyrin repeat protein